MLIIACLAESQLKSILKRMFCLRDGNLLCETRHVFSNRGVEF